MAAGGARPGSGRKPGGANQKTREIADRAAREGLTPLEVMIRAMRELVEEADRIKHKVDEIELVGPPEGTDPKDADRLRQVALAKITEAAAVAKDAAPYMHPRLANVISTVDANVKSQVKIVSEFGDE